MTRMLNKLPILASVTLLGGLYNAALHANGANLATNGSFETPESTFVFGFPGLPSAFGDWGGDLSQIVSAENGISPFDAANMLRFDATGNSADPLLVTSEIRQWIDLSAHSSAIATGESFVSISVWFNRVAGDAETDTGMSWQVTTNSGTPTFTTADYAGGGTAQQSAGIATDGDPSTWEEVTDEVSLPADTTYLILRLTASENVSNDGAAPEFDGHYADQVSVVLFDSGLNCGDADSNGSVTIVDALAIARDVAGLPPPPPVDPQAANVNGDGAVTIVDALLIARHVAGLPVEGTCLAP